MGFLKNELSGPEKSELLGLIEDYRQELAPLLVPKETEIVHDVGRRVRALRRALDQGGRGLELVELEVGAPDEEVELLVVERPLRQS